MEALNMTRKQQITMSAPATGQLKDFPFKKTVLLLVLAGTLPFSGYISYLHYFLLLFGAFIVIRALLSAHPEKISRNISTLLILTCGSFLHVAVLNHFGQAGYTPGFFTGIMEGLRSEGTRDFLVKTGLFIGIFLLAHTALVRCAMRLTGTSTGLFLGRRVPDTGTGIIRQRGEGILLRKDVIDRRRRFLRVGHYFSETGNIGTQIYRSYLFILVLILLMFLVTLAVSPAGSSDFLSYYSRTILYLVIGMIPFSLVVIATVLLSIRFSLRHNAALR